MNELWRRLLYLFHRCRLDRELEEEMQFHLDMKARRNSEAGLQDQDARCAARRQFGNPLLLRETSREMWGWAPLERLMHDVRYTLRMMANSPVFAAFAIASLALGIGVNTSIFNVVNSLLLQSAPGAQPERLIALFSAGRSSGGLDSMSTADYESYRDNAGVFESLSVYSQMDFSVRIAGETETVRGELVSDDFFSTALIRPALGRTFSPGLPGIVISYGFWQHRLGGDPNVTTKALAIGGGAIPIVGVAPKGFQGLISGLSEPPAVWIPYSLHTLAVPAWTDYGRGMHWWDVAGRLKPGMSLAQAQAAISTVSDRLAREYPDTDKDWTARIIPFDQARRMARGPFLNALVVLTLVGGIVLLITCANLANLLLARGWKRSREMALRVSLGATRGRLMAQLLTESMLLAVLGGSAGWILAVWSSELLGRSFLPFRSSVENVKDTRVLLFALAASAVTGILFGLAPARQASRIDLSNAVKASDPVGRGRRGLRNTLVASQVGLSLLLLIGAALFLKTLENARSSDITLAARNVLLAGIDIAERPYTTERRNQFWPQLLQSVRSLPGVTSASLVWITPYAGGRGGDDVIVNDQQRVQVDFNVVATHYFETIGIPLIRGRDFNEKDDAGASARVIVNEEFARRFWPGDDPLGKTFRIVWFERRQGLDKPNLTTTMVEVIGLVHDGKFRGFRSVVAPCFYRYLPQANIGIKRMTLEVRTAGKPHALARPLRAAVARLDPDLPLNDVRTWQEHVARSMAQENMLAAAFSGFGLLALLLAAIGTYGVISFKVAQRTREIGIRVALGATRTNILGDVIGGMLPPVAVGIVAGVAAALALARFVKSMLYGVGATDLTVFLAVAAIELGVALAASYVPGRRAMKVDPMEALRYE